MMNTENRLGGIVKTGCLGCLGLLVVLALVGRNCSPKPKPEQEAPVAPVSKNSALSPVPAVDSTPAESPTSAEPPAPQQNPSAISDYDPCNVGFADGYEDGYAAGIAGRSYDYNYFWGNDFEGEKAVTYREYYDSGFQSGYNNGRAEYEAEKKRREEEERIRRMSWRH